MSEKSNPKKGCEEAIAGIKPVGTTAADVQAAIGACGRVANNTESTLDLRAAATSCQRELEDAVTKGVSYREQAIKRMAATLGSFT